MSLGLLGAACGSPREGDPPRAVPSPASEVAAPDEEAAPLPRTETASRAALRVAVSREGECRLVPIVTNVGAERVALSTRIVVQKEAGGRFEDIASDVRVRASCGSEVPSCVALVPGAELRPIGWRGVLGEGQCTQEGGEEGEPATPGRYRFVLSGCDEGSARFVGETFALSARTSRCDP